MTDFLSSLNEEQRQAVLASEGPLLILAGAGSGKTRVIAHRIAYLIAEGGVAPWHILAVTFTNKASQEMRSRVDQLLKGLELSSAPLISTFHSLCVRILRRDIQALNEAYTRSFTIYDQDDSLRLVKNCIKDLGLDDKTVAPRAAQAAISAAKNRGQDPDSYAARAEYIDEKRASIARVFQLYEERLRNNNALDFDDLLIKAVRLLRDVPEVREKYNDRFRYILVDEYQDTNSLQFALVSFLTQKQQNICVVGDPDQSIYKWRGADITNILNFEQHFPTTQVIRLEQNYRSTQNILDVASAVVRHNVERKEKSLWTQNPPGERIRYYQAFDAEAEARFVAARIEEHRATDSTIRAAVLYRTNAQSRVFEEAMRRASLPYNIVGGFSFYERMEVRDVIAYLKLAMNPNDSIALQRVINSPPRGIGKLTLDEIERHAKDYGVSHWETISILTGDGQQRLSMRATAALKNFQRIILHLAELAGTPVALAPGVTNQGLELVDADTSPPAEDAKEEDAGNGADHVVLSDSPVSDLVKAAILDTGYENALKGENTDEAEARLENLQELVNAAVDYDEMGAEGLREFIDHSALVSDADQYKRDAPVTIMTAHSAKGLEFPLVFIVGLEDGLFPHSRSATDAAELEEERRLCYVAMTRAERFLYVTHAVKRRVYGEELASEPSQFLNEMPLELIDDLTRGNSWLSFARGSSSLKPEQDDTVLKSHRDTKARAQYSGKTYDSAESIAEFFRNRAAQMPGGMVEPKKSSARGTSQGVRSAKLETRNPKLETAIPSDFSPGSYVRHAKYGRGLVLRREGVGDSLKLTVTFPGYGQKKLVQKYAGLEKG
ncbi:MAG: UvrD-helicase domain-containing protein [Pyrinomonadaceae bacterium]